LIRWATGSLTAGFVLAACMVVADTQRAAHATTEPGRIVCDGLFCAMGSGTQPNAPVRVTVSNLPGDEIPRLRKCTGMAKPCTLTIEGTRPGHPTKIMASAIPWQSQSMRVVRVQAKWVQTKSVQAKSGPAKFAQVKSVHAKSVRTKSVQTKSVRAKSRQANRALVQSAAAEWGQAKWGQAKWGQAKWGQSKWGQAKWGQD
jgi:hypothetical protein